MWPYEENVADEPKVAFQFHREVFDQFGFKIMHEYVGVRRGEFGAHCSAIYLQVVFIIEGEVVAVKYHFMRLKRLE